MEFVKVKEEDLDEILEIEEENFLLPYQKKDFLYELNNNPFSNFYVVKEDGDIKGYIIFWITFDSSTLCKIAVKNGEKNKGFAGFLLKNAEFLLKNNDVEFMTLEVRVSNYKAINFYKKHGFSTILTKEKYYENGEDAYYMMKGI